MPDPLRTDKLDKDMESARKTSAQDRIVAKAIARKRRKSRISKIAEDCSDRLYKIAERMQPGAPDMSVWPGAQQQSPQDGPPLNFLREMGFVDEPFGQLPQNDPMAGMQMEEGPDGSGGGPIGPADLMVPPQVDQPPQEQFPMPAMDAGTAEGPFAPDHGGGGPIAPANLLQPAAELDQPGGTLANPPDPDPSPFSYEVETELKGTPQNPMSPEGGGTGGTDVGAEMFGGDPNPPGPAEEGGPSTPSLASSGEQNGAKGLEDGGGLEGAEDGYGGSGAERDDVIANIPTGEEDGSFLSKLLGAPGKAWGQWADTDLAGSSDLAKYGIPAGLGIGGGALAGYLLHKLLNGRRDDEEKTSYDKLAAFPLPSVVGSIQRGSQYGLSALPASTAQSVPCRLDSGNGQSSSTVDRTREKHAGWGFWKQEGSQRPFAKAAGGTVDLMTLGGVDRGIPGAGMGAAIGGVGGAGVGAMFPGEDEEGKKRSRILQALKLGLLGAIGGGVGGGAIAGAHGAGEGRGLAMASMLNPAEFKHLQEVVGNSRTLSDGLPVGA